MDLTRLFAPASVALVGATDRPGSYGAQVLANLARSGFAGRIVGVHPTRREVSGIACLPRLDDLPEPVDAVVVATPAATVPGILRTAGRLGCGGAVVFAAGFREAGDGAAQDLLAGAAREHGLPVIGPNANGLVAVGSRAPLWGDPVRLPERAGSVAIVTQSGNLGVIALAHRAGLGLHSVVALGNAAVVDAAAVIGHLGARECGEVRCVAACLEDDGDGARLAAALAACAAADVRLVVLKAGRSAAGRAAGAAHTAALSGDHAAFAALVEAAGGVLVSEPHALFETARALAGGRRRPGGVAVLTCSGGDAALAADLAHDLDVGLAELTAATSTALRVALPATATVSNPLDHTNLVWADPPALARIAGALGSDPAVGQLLYVQDEPPGLPAADAAEWAATRAGALAGARAAGQQPLLVATTPGQEPPGAVSGLRCALAAVGALRDPAPDAERLAQIGRAAERVRGRADGRWLAEHEAKQLLTTAGIAVPRGEVAATAAQACAAAARVGLPVALKLSATGLVHKTEIGALALDLGSEADVERAALRLLTGAQRSGWQHAVLLVEAMVETGPQVFVAARSAGVVPTLTIGLGGVWVEALADVATLPLPVTAERVLAGLRRLRGHAVLSARPSWSSGAEPPDLQTLAELAGRVGELLLRERLTLIELNPVIVGARSATAVDAVLRRAVT